MEINSRLFDALGMTLVDSLWQGAIVMSIAFLGLWLMKKRKASVRHNFLLICMLALPVLGIYSFSQRFERATPIDISTNEEVIANGLPSFDFSTESIPTTEVAQSETFEWMEMIPWIGILWTIGLAFILIRSAGSYLYLNRLKATAIDIIDDEIIRQFNALKESVNLKGRVLLRESAKISSPMVYGYFKPIILFPLGLIQGLRMDEVEVILLHELAHIKRNDFLINIIINGLRAVYFYHPAFWWLQTQLDNEREFAADEMVMEKKTDGLVLVRALSKAQEFSMLSPSLGFAGSSKNQLLKRVNRIMKKQQKPNWTGLILPCAILLSVFLLSSQSEKAELNDLEGQPDTKELVAQDDTVKNISIPLFTRDSLNKPQFTGQYTKTYWNPGQAKSIQSDSVSLAKATMELLEDPSPVTVTVGSDGKPIQIKRNGKVLAGETLKVYEEAYLKLNKYATEAADKRISGFMGANDRQFTERLKKATDDSKSQKIRLRDNGIEEVVKLEKQLEREKVLMDEMIIAISKNPKASNQEVIALNEQVTKVGQLEEIVRMVQLTMTDLQIATLREKQREFEQRAKLIEIEQINQKQMHKLHQEKLEQMTAQEREALFALEKNFSAESKELGKMVFELTSNPNDADPAAVAKQAQKYAQIEEQLAAMLGGPAAAKSHIDSLKRVDESRYKPLRSQNQIQEEKRQQQLIKEQVTSDIFKGTSYSEDGKSIDFHLGQEGLEFAQREFRAMQVAGSRPILEIDGVLMPNTKLSDVKMDNVRSIAVYKGAAQQKMYPYGETKGYDGLIVIKTSEGIKGNGPVNATTFSEDYAIHSQAMQVAGSRPILEIDGVLMPNAKLSDVKMDNVISIEVLKGKAMQKRYPNGEAKGRDGLIVITTLNNLKKELSKMNLLERKMTFKNTAADQNKATQLLEKRKSLFDNPVVVFNGEFMPKNYILKYKDTYIKEVNIYKGDALSKFPKRKIKGHDAVIEVITN